MKDKIKSYALDFIHFLNTSPTPFHAVANCENLLKEANFIELDETQHFKVQPGDRCYMKKGQTTIFAFVVGGKWKPGDGGFSMVATHTDSCCLRMKPISKKSSQGFLQLGVSTYGGGIWRTWFDRDLSLAGQVIVKGTDKDWMECKLVDLKRTILHIPSLAIHLDDQPGNKFEFNVEQHLCPLFACASGQPAEEELIDEMKRNCSLLGEHHSDILKAIAAEADCLPEEIVDMDMYLYDTQKACISGLDEQFISGARLDNLVSTYCAIRALIESVEGENGALNNDPNIRLVACYDNEEVQSESAQGAKSAITKWLLRRICANSEEQCAFERTIGHSFLISADKAHAAHPNYPEKHEDNHRPRFGRGPVVKFHQHMDFMSSAMTEAIVKLIADKAGIPLQKYTFRNDNVRGCTIGPILAAELGIQTVDIGCQPQLAMHSIREFGDVEGIRQSVEFFKAFFVHLPFVLKKIRKCK